MDRTIHFGDDEADARYRIQDTSSTGGDFVLAEDLDGGTVLLEYDYSASEWVSRGPVNLSGNDISNAGSISANTLEATNGTVWDSSQNTHLNTQTHVATDALSDVTATTYTSVGAGNGIFDLREIPSGADLYGYFYVRGSAPSGETMDVRPALNNITPNKTFNPVGLDSVGVTFDDINQNKKSGWQKITELNTSKIYHFSRIQAQVSGGTGSFSGSIATLAIAWRLK